jgi:hypothetical protein
MSDAPKRPTQPHRPTPPDQFFAEWRKLTGNNSPVDLDVDGIDWRETLFKILDAIVAQEGAVFESAWTEHGVTEAERELILTEWEARAARMKGASVDRPPE